MRAKKKRQSSTRALTFQIREIRYNGTTQRNARWKLQFDFWLGRFNSKKNIILVSLAMN